MHRYAYLLLLLLPSATWAQDQKAAPAATAAAATIYFYRPHRFEGAALKPPVIVDEVDVAHLHNGDAVQVTVNPGSHKLHSNDKSTGIELETRNRGLRISCEWTSRLAVGRDTDRLL